jgi:hypothetical protein
MSLQASAVEESKDNNGLGLCQWQDLAEDIMAKKMSKAHSPVGCIPSIVRTVDQCKPLLYQPEKSFSSRPEIKGPRGLPCGRRDDAGSGRFIDQLSSLMGSFSSI